MIDRWFYISTSRLGDDDADELISDIVDVAIPRNRSLDVTGALLFTGRHFAQYLEGPASAIRQLRRSIEDDMRHEDIRTIAEGKYPHRMFVTWSLAYLAPSPLLSVQVQSLLADAAGNGDESVETLAQFLCQSATRGNG
ncbi:MAG TPA: BLUF domain-containing protein [Sphingobium sp.]|nr:BLUF domain-containing protein [Sphingobium sp.]